MNVTIKNIAKIMPATINGHLKIFCKAMENMITARGIAKNISRIFIIFLLYFFYILCYMIDFGYRESVHLGTILFWTPL